MTKGTETVLREALNLAPLERAELIEGLFHSFEKTDTESEALWIKEAEARIDAHNAGRISSDSAEEIFRRLGNL